MDVHEESAGQAAARVAEALGDQLELHVELMKAELARDVQAVARDLLPLVAGLPLIGIGYIFVCVAAAAALAPWLGTAGALAVLGALNLLVGALALRRSMGSLRTRRLLGAAVEAPHVR